MWSFGSIPSAQTLSGSLLQHRCSICDQSAAQMMIFMRLRRDSVKPGAGPNPLGYLPRRRRWFLRPVEVCWQPGNRRGPSGRGVKEPAGGNGPRRCQARNKQHNKCVCLDFQKLSKPPCIKPCAPSRLECLHIKVFFKGLFLFFLILE